MNASFEQKHAEFAGLHRAGDPLILFNIWDAGSAKAVADTGAKALATGSASLAGAQGFDDGEGIPFEQLCVTVRQIVGAIDLPISVDFEMGFAETPQELRANARALIERGAVGCNLEDRLIEDGSLRPIDAQCERIEAAASAGLWVNARTDTFLSPLTQGEDPNNAELVEAAIERSRHYAQAGASSFFVPGLSAPDLIAQVCEAVSLPVNVMRLPGMVENAELARLGVARISYGPGPWRETMCGLRDAAREVYS